ncbi:MAG: glycosyltransferase family 39 protein [Clostridia bacterium]|nr:glycosyltransferase family 39 protein [Clostridia bacterium]
MNRKRSSADGFIRFCGGAAIALLLAVLLPLAVCGLRISVFQSIYGKYEESITFLADSLLPNIALTLAVLAALLLAHAFLTRFARVHMDKALYVAWFAVAVFWVLGIGLVQEVDCKDVMDAAKLFARGNYRPMRMAYFSAYPYQLAVSLFMEAVMRLMPFVDINLFMQVLNVMLSTITMALLGALAEILFESRSARIGTQVMMMAFVPYLLFNTYVYGTIPMIFFCALAFVCFALYVRGGSVRYALVCMVSLGCAYAAKQNALIVILALTICGVLHAIRTRDIRLPAMMAMGLVIGTLLSSFAVWQYEVRSGMQLGANVSALARLVMGLQESETCAGWFNGYTAPFIDLEVSAAEQAAVASADLKTRLAEFAADPGMALAFFRDKYLSQWLEPGYSTLWWGYRCSWEGRYNGLAILLYREESPIRALAEGYMNLYQQAMYILAVIGAAASMKRRGDTAALMLPVTIVGGFLFHMLFEAKSQYIFVYAVYLMPLAGCGLSAVGAWIGKRMKRR